MDLAKLIHHLMTNSSARYALAHGELALQDIRLSPQEVAAVAAVLRDSRYLHRSGDESLFEKLFNTVCGWSGDTSH
jgi:hypothetical protein